MCVQVVFVFVLKQKNQFCVGRRSCLSELCVHLRYICRNQERTHHGLAVTAVGSCKAGNIQTLASSKTVY